MAFPINPTNGQQTTENGIVYTYNSTLDVWAVGTNAGAAISANTLAVSNSATVGTTLVVSGNVSGGNLSTGGLISATGNVSGGNLSTGGLISATGNVSGGNLNVTGNIVDSGPLSIITSSNGNISLAPNGTGVVTTAAEFVFNNGSADGAGLVFKSAGFTDYQIDNASGALRFFQPGVARASLDANGHFSPAVNNAQDLGTTSLRWRNIYTNDLQLSNGIGDYTVVEGEEDLFLYNNKTGKTFKFALIEVDPSTVPPKSKTE